MVKVPSLQLKAGQGIEESCGFGWNKLQTDNRRARRGKCRGIKGNNSLIKIGQKKGRKGQKKKSTGQEGQDTQVRQDGPGERQKAPNGHARERNLTPKVEKREGEMSRSDE